MEDDVEADFGEGELLAQIGIQLQASCPVRNAQ